MQDLRYAGRQLRRTPVFSAAAVLTLALGIGSNTAIFSVADAVLLRPLPYPNSERLVMVWNELSKINVRQMSLSAEDFDAFRADNRVFETAAAFHEDLGSAQDDDPATDPGRACASGNGGGLAATARRRLRPWRRSRS